MTPSEIAETAWKRAARILAAETKTVKDEAVRSHIEAKVIPSLEQRARIIARNRKSR